MGYGRSCSAVVWLFIAVTQAPPSGLHFRDGTFKILQFADLHYGASLNDGITALQQSRLLELEKPDLVVLTGDNIAPFGALASQNCLQHGGSAGCWRSMVSPMVQAGCRWAAIFGSHDEHGDLNKEQLMEVDKSFNLSVSNFTAESPHYWLPVYTEQGTSVKVVLYMFHSAPADCWWTPGAWGSSIDWYRQTFTEVPNPHTAVAFMHVPLPEYMYVWNGGDAMGDMADESVSCLPPEGEHLFNVMLQKDNVALVVAGHDHDNNFIGVYEGIPLAYGYKTGKGGYFRPGALEGARVIHLRETTQGAVMKTWIRLVNGTKVTQRSQGAKRHTIHYCCQTVKWYDISAGRWVASVLHFTIPKLEQSTTCPLGVLFLHAVGAAVSFLSMGIAPQVMRNRLRWYTMMAMMLYITCGNVYLIGPLFGLLDWKTAWSAVQCSAIAVLIAGNMRYRRISKLSLVSLFMLALTMSEPKCGVLLFICEVADFLRTEIRRAHPYAAFGVLMAIYLQSFVAYFYPTSCPPLHASCWHIVMAALTWNWCRAAPSFPLPDWKKEIV